MLKSRSQLLSGLVFLTAGLMLVFGATASRAATVAESDLPGGAFSSLWSAPTEIVAGITSVTGTGSAGRFDNLVFPGLPVGAQTITIDFMAPPSIGWSYAAGGSVLVSNAPFRWGWDGLLAGTVSLNYLKRSQRLTMNLTDQFAGGPLYMAMNFTWGNGISYTISAPSNLAPPPPTPPVAPVPAPAAAGLLGGALLGLGLLARRRGKTAA
ncbi:MAG: hypothetical protein ACRCSU_01105 [Paracoccaceae bacterium]